MIRFPNAKVNIGLNVVERRSDGYHNIETVFYPIPLYDVLEVMESKEMSMAIEGIRLDGRWEENLVVRAYNLLKEEFDLPPVEITLLKNIPAGAGLGGGSADAAEMLKALNELFCLRLEYNELEEFASKLGADCAFFIRNKPVFAEGIGNVFSDVNISLKGIYMILIKPNIHVSTKEAYGGIIPHRRSMPLKEALRLSVDRWEGVVRNDFEESVFKKYPQIGQIKAWLYERGAVYTAMSGSGSSVFGLFNEDPKIEEINAGWFYKKLCL